MLRRLLSQLQQLVAYTHCVRPCQWCDHNVFLSDRSVPPYSYTMYSIYFVYNFDANLQETTYGNCLWEYAFAEKSYSEQRRNSALLIWLFRLESFFSSHFWNLISALRWNISWKWQNRLEILQLPSKFFKQNADIWRARFMCDFWKRWKSRKLIGFELATLYRRSSKRYDEDVKTVLVGLEETYKSPYCASCHDSRLRYNLGTNMTEIRKWPGFKPHFLELQVWSQDSVSVRFKIYFFATLLRSCIKNAIQTTENSVGKIYSKKYSTLDISGTRSATNLRSRWRCRGHRVLPKYWVWPF